MITQELDQAFWEGVKVVSLLPDDGGATGIVLKVRARPSIAYVKWDDGQLSWSPIEFLEKV